MDLALGMSVAEMKGMYAEDVRPEQRKSLDAAVKSMREALRSGKVSVAALQPFMQEMQKSVGDGKVTVGEAKSLEETARRTTALHRR